MPEQKKIIVLGAKGMLGQMCMRYFDEQGYETIGITARFSMDNRQKFLDEIIGHENGVVINAIGKIKQKTEDDFELINANALLPLFLSEALPENFMLIHPSTDCVFSGDKGEPYEKDDSADAPDTYGYSKRLGEVALEGRSNTMVFRVSIIGPDKSGKGKGLLAWFLSNDPGAELKGFSNHKWNGITTLEWCKKANEYIQKGPIKGYEMYQLGTKESYTKYEMLQLFQEVYGSDYQISSFDTDKAVDRRLEPEIIVPDLKHQLEELRPYH